MVFLGDDTDEILLWLLFVVRDLISMDCEKVSWKGVSASWKNTLDVVARKRKRINKPRGSELVKYIPVFAQNVTILQSLYFDESTCREMVNAVIGASEHRYGMFYFDFPILPGSIAVLNYTIDLLSQKVVVNMRTLLRSKKWPPIGPKRNFRVEKRNKIANNLIQIAPTQEKVPISTRKKSATFTSILKDAIKSCYSKTENLPRTDDYSGDICDIIRDPCSLEKTVERIIKEKIKCADEIHVLLLKAICDAKILHLSSIDRDIDVSGVVEIVDSVAKELKK